MRGYLFAALAVLMIGVSPVDAQFAPSDLSSQTRRPDWVPERPKYNMWRRYKQQRSQNLRSIDRRSPGTIIPGRTDRRPGEVSPLTEASAAAKK